MAAQWLDWNDSKSIDLADGDQQITDDTVLFVGVYVDVATTGDCIVRDGTDTSRDVTIPSGSVAGRQISGAGAKFYEYLRVIPDGATGKITVYFRKQRGGL